MHIGLYVKYLLLLSEFDDTLIFATDFQTIRYHENPSSRRRVVLRGWTDRQTERERETARQTERDRCTEIYDEADNRFSQFCESN